MIARAIALCFALIGSAATAAKPNVLIIVADDLGYNDVGFNGGKQIPTPHLDALAASGVRCTSGYVSHPFCSPTRAGLLTGRYQQRFGHENNPGWDPTSTIKGLPLSQITLPQQLQKAGYTTGAVGKWHLGAHPQFHPNKRGFDEYFGILGGGHVYFPGAQPGGVEYSIPMNRNGVEEPLKGYMTEELGKEAAAFVDRHAKQDKPWLLYLAFNAPHTPLQAPPAWLEKSAHITDKSRQTYAAMVAALDAEVGRVIAQLDATGQRERTLVCFTSDNGGPNLSAKSGSNFTDNSPLRGAKGMVYDGGIRVPFLLSWPSKLKAGSVYDQPVIALDFYATALAIGGGEVPTDRQIDSVNLLPHLTGEQAGAPHAALFWRSNGPGGNLAIRAGDWKMVRLGKTPDQLYNLASDIGEAHDLAAEKPDVLARLQGELNAWDQQLINPVFPGAAAKKQAAKGKAKGNAKAKAKQE